MCGHGRIESRVNGNTSTPLIAIANEHIKATSNMLPKMMQAKKVNTSWHMFNACWRIYIDNTLVRDTGITAHVRYIKEQSKWQQVPSFQGELKDTKLVYAVLDLLCWHESQDEMVDGIIIQDGHSTDKEDANNEELRR